MNVINPIWFYLCDVFDIIKTFAGTAAGLIGIAWAFDICNRLVSSNCECKFGRRRLRLSSRPGTKNNCKETDDSFYHCI